MAKISKKDYLILNKALYRERPEHEDVEGIMHGLNPPQVELITAFKNPDITTIFAPWGRKCGKTHGVLHIAWEQAVLHPGSHILYVAPTRADGENIIWKNRRVQKFLGEDIAKHFIQGMPNNRDLVIRLKNGSYIQVMGSERYENANGLSPDLIIYDEFKAFHPEFHRTMSMNVAAKGAKLVVIGTKADHLARNKREYNAMLKIAKENPSQKCIEATTFCNPLNHRPRIHKRIMDDIEALRKQGREDVIQREYYNKIIAGGSRSVFPLFNEKSFVIDHDILRRQHTKVANDLEWYQVIDPGTTSVFGGLFIAYNPYTGMVDVMDELYESGPDTTITRVGKKIKQIALNLQPGKYWEKDWFLRYDEAGVWAAKEIQDQFDVVYTPTDKNNAKKDDGLSLINHVLDKKLMRISSRCENLISEMLGYAKDDYGKIRKGDDHNIDSLRYFFQACNYTVELLSHKPAPKTPDGYKNVSIASLFDSDGLDSIDFNIDIDWDV